jgi:hypothetical protein
VKTYLRPEMCEHPEHSCPLATLGPELARVEKKMKPQIVAELVNYKSRMVPFMPGRRTADKERESPGTIMRQSRDCRCASGANSGPVAHWCHTKTDWQSEGIFWSAPCQFVSVLSHFSEFRNEQRDSLLGLNGTWSPEDVRKRCIDRDE